MLNIMKSVLKQLRLIISPSMLRSHNSDIKDYQTNVQSPEIGVNRGYLANAEEGKSSWIRG